MGKFGQKKEMGQEKKKKVKKLNRKMMKMGTKSEENGQKWGKIRKNGENGPKVGKWGKNWVIWAKKEEIGGKIRKRAKI